MNWTPVNTGRSGARVWRAPGFYRKRGAPAAIAAEAHRLAWLAGRGIACPRVVEVAGDTLTTTALPGRPAAELTDPGLQDRAVESCAALVRALHAIPLPAARPGRLPGERPLALAVAQAQAAVSAGRVDLADLDDERHGWTAGQLLGELHHTRPAEVDPVVCHGDLTLDNVLVDDTGAATGVVDVGGLAVADRYQDLALVTRDLLGWSPAHAERFLTAYGVDVADPAKLAFYRLLDEFF